jgi:hypothetical protein
MPPPARLRDHSLEGRCGWYRVATQAQVDAHLRALQVQFKTAVPSRAAKIAADIDLLLERRLGLETPCLSATSSDGSSAPS